MKKKTVGFLLAGSLCLAGIATLGLSDTALLWFVNQALPGANLSQKDLEAARATALRDCKDIVAPALRKQCMLDSLSHHLAPTRDDSAPTSEAGHDGVLHT